MLWIDHIGMVVPHLPEAVTFYRELFGRDLLDSGQWHGANANYVADMLGRPHGLELEAAFFQVPHSNAILELIEYSGIDQVAIEPDATDIGAVHVGFYVDSVTQTLKQLELPLTGSVTDIPYGPSKGGRTAYLKAPARVNLQLMELRSRPGMLPILAGADFWIDHVGMVVNDLQTTVRFFTRLLRTTLLDSDEWRGPNADYVADMLGRPHGMELEAAFIQVPHTISMLELIKYSGIPQRVVTARPTDLGAVHLGFYVDSVDEALMRVDGPTAGSVTTIPHGPSKGGRTAYLTSPDGVNIQLMELKSRPGRLPILRRSAPLADRSSRA